ncbi:tyrosine protein phosphatase [Agrobacterium rubi]|nr:tyrosine protein phosphatase [Agrobacterium rubi]NTF24604.1 tyrosine protein phosphatase [Agrobacterium rubi]
MQAHRITVRNMNQARRAKRRHDAVLTIEDPGQRHPLRFHSAPHPEQLVMKFEDVDFHEATIALPREEHVTAAIEFGRRHRDGSILIHCRAGIARSTALALAIIADRLGAGREKEAVADLLVIRPEAAPNLIMLAMTDTLLGRGGALVNAWMEVENSDERYADHRKKKLEILRRRPEAFARASANVSGSILRFENNSITPRLGPFAD